VLGAVFIFLREVLWGGLRSIIDGSGAVSGEHEAPIVPLKDGSPEAPAAPRPRLNWFANGS
jgi:hypothetical protein